MHRSASRILPLVVTLGMSCLLSGCNAVKSAVTGASYGARSATNAWFARSVDDATLEVDLAGPVSVRVDSFGGDVIVEVDDRLERAEVTITRYATHGSGRKEEAIASLDDIATLVEVRQGELGQELRVRATTGHAEPWFQKVKIEIAVPEVDGLFVTTGAGDVLAENVYGLIDVRTGGGDVSILSMRPLIRPVTIINDAGSIRYRVRGESAGAIDAHAPHGRVSHNVRYGTFQIAEGRTESRLQATFNEGRNPIVLRAAYGDIRIAVVDAPTYVGRWILD